MALPLAAPIYRHTYPELGPYPPEGGQIYDAHVAIFGAPNPHAHQAGVNCKLAVSHPAVGDPEEPVIRGTAFFHQNIYANMGGNGFRLIHVTVLETVQPGDPAPEVHEGTECQVHRDKRCFLASMMMTFDQAVDARRMARGNVSIRKLDYDRAHAIFSRGLYRIPIQTPELLRIFASNFQDIRGMAMARLQAFSRVRVLEVWHQFRFKPGGRMRTIHISAENTRNAQLLNRIGAFFSVIIGEDQPPPPQISMGQEMIRSIENNEEAMRLITRSGVQYKWISIYISKNLRVWEMELATDHGYRRARTAGRVVLTFGRFILALNPGGLARNQTTNRGV